MGERHVLLGRKSVKGEKLYHPPTYLNAIVVRDS